MSYFTNTKKNQKKPKIRMRGLDVEIPIIEEEKNISLAKKSINNKQIVS